MAQAPEVPDAPALRYLRRLTPWTQADVAEAVGLTQSQYSRVETGQQWISSAQWMAAAPLLAIFGEREQRPYAPVEANNLCFLLAWSPARMESPKYVQSQDGRVLIYERGPDACTAAGTLGRFSAPCVVIPATYEFAAVDVLFKLGGKSEAEWIGDSKGRLGPALAYSLEVTAGALWRYLDEHEEGG